MYKKVKKAIKKVIRKVIPIKKSNFRIASKKLFLTYSQCNLKPFECLNILEEKFKLYTIEKYIITKEYHADNKGEHIHVFIELAKKIDCKNQSFFNMHNNEIIFKGNYQGCKQKEKVIEYIIKDVFDLYDQDIVVMDEYTRLFIDTNGSLVSYQQAMISLAERGRINEAMNILKNSNPSQYLKSHMSIEKSLRSLNLKKVGLTQKYSLSQFNIPNDLRNALDKALNAEKTLWIKGDSGTGKTQLVKTAIIDKLKGKPLMINDVNSIGKFVEGTHVALLIDDMNFDSKKITREKLIKLLDTEEETTFDIKHGSIQIPKKVPRLITSNKSLDYYFDTNLVNSIEVSRRMIFIDIGSKSLIPEPE